MRLLALGVVLTTLLAAESARACSCVAIEPAAAFDGSDAVFEGRVLEVERAAGALRVTLAIVQQWKGITSERVVVETAADSAACGVAFEADTSWLVYAEREGDRFRTGLCSRTSRIEDAQADLAVLGAGVVPVEIGPDDGVEEEATRAPARGGCASCSASNGTLDRRALGMGIALALAIGFRRRRARAARR